MPPTNVVVEELKETGRGVLAGRVAGAASVRPTGAGVPAGRTLSARTAVLEMSIYAACKVSAPPLVTP